MARGKVAETRMHCELPCVLACSNRRKGKVMHDEPASPLTRVIEHEMPVYLTHRHKEREKGKKRLLTQSLEKAVLSPSPFFSAVAERSLLTESGGR